MLLSIVSTWKSRCGIATYSEYLVDALKEHVRVEVLGAVTPGESMPIDNGIPVRYCWVRGSDNLVKSVAECTRGRDVVHFQHEYGLFPDNDIFFDALRAAHDNGAKTVVTLHTPPLYGSWETVAFIDKLCVFSDAIIVHTAIGSACLGACARPPIWIRHGTRVDVHGDRQKGLDLLNIPIGIRSWSFGGSIGFIGENKNIAATLRAFATGMSRGLIPKTGHAFIVAGDVPDAGYAFQDAKSPYLLHLEDVVNKICHPGVLMRSAFIPRESLGDVMAVLDYGVLNTRADTYSASGQVHEYIAHGVPLIVAQRHIYADAIEAGSPSFIPIKEPGAFSDEMVSAIAGLATNRRLRQSISWGFEAYRTFTSWKNIGKAHLRVYKELTGIE